MRGLRQHDVCQYRDVAGFVVSDVATTGAESLYIERSN